MTKRISQAVFLALAALLLLALPVAALFAPARENEISLYENRRLAEEPVFTREALMDGSYAPALEAYLQDHIPGRDALLRLDAALQRAAGRPFVNDVLLSRGALLPYRDSLTRRDTAADAAEMADRLAALSRQVERWGGVFLYVGVANQYSVCRDDYPAYMNYVGAALDETRGAFYAALEEAGVLYLDLASSADPEDYFRTDHHMRLPGAVAACGAVFDALRGLGVEIPAIEDYTYRELPNPFYGSRSRGLYGLVPFTEPLLVFDRGPSVPFTRRDDGAAVPAEVLDLPETAEEPVNYGVFLGGDVAETVIDTGRPELASALLFGDSYTNAVETVFYTGFDETRYLDLRYYEDMSLTEYLEAYRPAVVVCLRDDGNYLTLTGNGDFGN